MTDSQKQEFQVGVKVLTISTSSAVIFDLHMVHQQYPILLQSLVENGGYVTAG